MGKKSDKEVQLEVNTTKDDSDIEADMGGEFNEDKTVEKNTDENDRLPIDRGWAWVVLAGCFLNAMLIVGYNRSLALFFVEFLEMFEASAASTTMIMGVKALSYSLFSLVTMHVILEFMGTRKTVMIGGMLFSLSILSASFAENIVVLICLHVSLGIGHSMIHSPGLVLISKYFKKRRSLATTTASSAISFSSGVFPLFSEYLLNKYGVRGAILILSGLTMNILVGASVYRPLESYKRNGYKVVNAKEESEPMISNQPQTRVIVNKSENSRFTENEFKNLMTSRTDQDTRKSNMESLSRSVEAYENIYLSPAVDDQFRRRTYSEGANYNCRQTVTTAEKLAYTSNPDFMSVSLVDIKQNTDEVETSNKAKNKKESSLCESFKKILKAFDFSLFKKPLFLLLAAISHLAVIIRLAQIYLPARVNELGFSQSDAAILLLITGILDFFCRILYGFLADLKFLKVHQIMAIGLTITGIATVFMFVYTTFTLLIAYAVVNGIFGSAYQCLVPVVVVEFMGAENMAKTLGFISLFQGFASGVSHPIIGGIRDVSGSYVACYIFIGTLSILAAGLLFCEPIVRRYEEKKGKS